MVAYNQPALALADPKISRPHPILPRSACLLLLQAAPFFDKLVFGKVKQRLGGNVKLIVSGGAPLAPHVEEFLKVAMCAPVVQVG
jgi:long-subunit acyl-CoA synthetase (AMP-forming)